MTAMVEVVLWLMIIAYNLGDGGGYGEGDDHDPAN